MKNNSEMDYKTLVCRIDVMYAIDINYNKKKLSYRKKKIQRQKHSDDFFPSRQKGDKISLAFQLSLLLSGWE